MELTILILVLVSYVANLRHRRQIRLRLWELSDKLDAELYARHILSLNSFRVKRKKEVVDELALLDTMLAQFESLTHDQPYEEALADADDLQCLKDARAEEWNAPTTSLDSVRKTLNI